MPSAGFSDEGLPSVTLGPCEWLAFQWRKDWCTRMATNANAALAELQSQLARLEGIISRGSQISTRRTPFRTPPRPSPAEPPVLLPPTPVDQKPHEPSPIFGEEKPLSVAVVRRTYRRQRQARERAELERSLVRFPPPPKRPKPSSPPASDRISHEDALSVSYAAILEPAARDRIVETVETELRASNTVRLVARLVDNDEDRAVCRLALRTLYAAIRPALVEAIPPVPRPIFDGSDLIIDPRRTPRP